MADATLNDALLFLWVGEGTQPPAPAEGSSATTSQAVGSGAWKAQPTCQAHYDR